MVRTFVIELLNIYALLIIVRALLSWVAVDPRNRYVRLLHSVTDPVLVPIQRVVPPIGGGIDISPIVAIFIVYLVKALVIRLF